MASKRTKPKPEPVLNEQYWATVISIAWQKATESILETGRLLIEAKGALQHGSWENMVEAGLPFGMNTAQRLMKIASNSVFSNTAHAPRLPPSWMTLYELTKLNEADLQTAIGDGRINPSMERKDVAAIRHVVPVRETIARVDDILARAEQLSPDQDVRPALTMMGLLHDR